MSLKAIHILFIVVSTVLAFGFGGWCFHSYAAGEQKLDLWFGIGSILSGVALVFYGRYVLKKLKHISYL